MRNYRWIAALLILLGLIIHVPVPVVSVEPVPPVVAASGTFEKYGPRVNDLIFLVDYDVDDFLWGSIDLMEIPVPDAYVSPWLSDPEITLGEFAEPTIYFLALNNQMWPTGHSHQWINYSCQRCLDSREFRRALTHLTDKTLWPSPQETFIPPMLHEWKNPNVTTYGNSLDLARDRLNSAGFNDYDGDGMLEYSPSHAIPSPPSPPADMEELPELQFYSRVDDPDRTIAGEQLRDEMIALGIPVRFFGADRAICYLKVYIEREYHVYTDAWTFTRNPSEYYEMFYSKYDGPFGNYIGYYSHEFDYWFEKLMFASTMDEAKEACNACQEIVARDVASIPQYAPWGYVAHRTSYGIHSGEGIYAGEKWEGFVNELGVGFSDFWTYLNAHPQSFERSGTLRQGLILDLESFNPVHAETFWDWLVLDQIYEPMIKNHPYNVTEKIPWLCRNWTTGTWEFEGKNCTKITFDLKFKTGSKTYPIFWHDLTPLTAEDVAFTLQYMKDGISVPFYRYVKDIDHVEVIDEYTVTVYYQLQSNWALDWAGSIPIIPKHIWEGKDFYTWKPEEHDAVIGTGPFMCNKDGVVGRPDHVDGNYIHLTANLDYFRRYIWPDVCNDVPAPVRDLQVKISDLIQVSLNAFTYDTRLPGYEFYPAWDAGWVVDGDQLLDVTKNGAIDSFDLVEIGVRLGQTWPPSWYVDC